MAHLYTTDSTIPGRELRPNLSTFADTAHSPVIRVVTNRYGMREEPLPRGNTTNTTQILVLGDSIAFGWGVNTSQRFSDIVEHRLNMEHDTRYQMINTAVPGRNIKTQYHLLEEKGLYSADIVVLTIVSNDVLSATQQNNILRNATQQIKATYSTETINQSGLKERLRQKKRAMLRSAREKKLSTQETIEASDFGTYIPKIISTIRENDAYPILYAVGVTEQPLTTYLKNWGEKNNVTTLFMPEKLHSFKYRLSREDPHPNAAGHQLLADKLYNAIPPTTTP